MSETKLIVQVLLYIFYIGSLYLIYLVIESMAVSMAEACMLVNTKIVDTTLNIEAGLLSGSEEGVRQLYAIT